MVAHLIGGYRIIGSAALIRTPIFDAYSARSKSGEHVCILVRDMGNRPFDQREFDNEVARLKLIRSKELPLVTDAGRAGSVHYVVTAPISLTLPIWRPRTKGNTIREFERRKAWLEVASWGVQIADLFISILPLNFFHGMLTPECIRMTDEGNLVVVGVGMARLFGLDRETVEKHARRFAPCQHAGSPIPENALPDLWALGSWMYGAATGVEPVTRLSPTKVTRHILSHVIPMEPLRSAKVPEDFVRAIELCMARRDGARTATAWTDARSALGAAALVALTEAEEKGQSLNEALDELGTPPPTPRDIVAEPPTLRAHLAPSGEPPVPLEDAVDFDKETPRPRPPRACATLGALALEADAVRPPALAPHNIYSSPGIVWDPGDNPLPLHSAERPPSLHSAERPPPLRSAERPRRQWGRWGRFVAASPLAAAAMLLLFARGWERPQLASPVPVLAMVPVEVVPILPPPPAPAPPEPPPSLPGPRSKASPREVARTPEKPAAVPKGCGDIYYCNEPEVLQ